MTSPGPVCGNVTRRSGTVAGVTGETIAFLAQALADEMEDGGCAYYGQVERLRIDGGQLVETGPGWDSAEDAVAWGRVRADVVLIRLGASPPQAYFSAGKREPSGPPLSRWEGRKSTANDS